MALKSLFTRALGAIGARAVRLARWAQPEVTFRDAVIGDLGSELDGYTIVVLSDFHHAPTGDTRWLHDVIDVVNAMSPDLIAFLGDYATSFKHMPFTSRTWYRTALSAMTSVFRRLRARDGLVAVLGNHDYYAGADAVRDWLRGIGADVLVNRPRLVRRGGSVLRVAGMDDIVEGELDARVGCEPSIEVPTIVLSHNPDGVMHLTPDVRVDVMLAGHTHGGQVVIPWYGAPLRMSRVCGRHTASGLVPHDRATLYVTRGLGAQLPLPVRFNCPPEIVVLRLTAGR